MFSSSSSHPKAGIQTLAERQLAALLKEAQQNNNELGYESQIKAAFYYQVALAFCEKKLNELAEAADAWLSYVARSTTATISPRDFRAFYTQEKEQIIGALAQLEFEYPAKALNLVAKTSLSSTSSASESKEPVIPLPTLEVIRERLRDNPYKKELNQIRAKAKNLLEEYKKTSTEINSAEGKVESKPQSMQEIYRELTTDMKQLVQKMIVDCVKEYRGILGVKV